jgi:hypothetical protein
MAVAPAGRHTVTVPIDGAASSCPFQLPPTSNPVNDPCSAGFSFTLPDQPTDGKYTEAIVVESAATSIEIKQTLDGTVISDQTLSPSYQTIQPNGPGCGPTCHQATAAWTIP